MSGSRMLLQPTTIMRGSMVKIRTVNGGEVTAKLIETYRPTYDACIVDAQGHWLVIPALRIKSIEVVP